MKSISSYLPFCWLLLGFVVSYGCAKKAEPVPKGPYIGPRLYGMLASADSALTAKDFRTALSRCDSILKIEPQLAYAHFLRARTLTEVKDLAAAGTELERVVDADPQYPAIWFNLGNNAFLREQYRQALKAYRRQWGFVKQSGGTVEKCSVLIQIGRSHKNLGQVDSAITAFRQVLKLDSKRSEVYNDLGHIAREDGDFERALEYQTRALELAPDNPEFHYFVGALLYQLGRYEEAIPHLRFTSTKKPWYHGAYYNLGRALIAMGRLDEGKTYLAKVDSLQTRAYEIGLARFSAEVNADRPGLWLALGNLYYEDNRYSDALDAYLIASYLEPENKDINREIKELRNLTTNKE